MAVPSDKYFLATVSCQVHKVGSLIKDKLSKEQLQMFDKIIFGPLLNVNMVFNGQSIHHFLQGRSENNKIITCLEVEEIFKNFEFGNDHDAVKVALAVFIETMMVRKDKKTQFDLDILGRVDDEEVWTYEVLSTASEHLVTKNSKGSIPRILRWNCTQAPSYKMLQKNIFDNKNTIVKPKLKLSTQEKAFMESRIRGDDNMEMEDDESILDINDNDTNTPDHVMNNQSLEQSDSFPQLSPRRKQS
ncbi:Ulp1-like peptidase [Cucumis melo var. makuwa]|uniref:Ulp1-like peptidase n=1 Tax=Cucumis melo var. makuwa TaxID=1194695 RepID=A0A5A7UM87_CUCMM|nr:Ulp1-like peptidase [Cucumis melo var. makuwa]TYK05248.1 Ulp1-like peptidase [Cucumis melo var. makuwa]